MVLGLRVEVTLDAVVDEGDEACGDDDTVDFVRWGQVRLRGIDLLGNVSECPQNALIADPH